MDELWDPFLQQREGGRELQRGVPRFPAMRSQHPELASPLKRCLGALATVSWPWVPACGSLEPPRRDGENAQKMGKNGEKMGKIQPKTCEGREQPRINWIAGDLGTIWVAFFQECQQ